MTMPGICCLSMSVAETSMFLTVLVTNELWAVMPVQLNRAVPPAHCLCALPGGLSGTTPSCGRVPRRRKSGA